MMSSSSLSSPMLLREPNNNNNNNNNNKSGNNNRGLIKANSFSFRRRYFFKPSADDHVTTATTPSPIPDEQRQPTFIRPQIESRTSLSLRSFRTSLDSNSGGFTRRGGGGGFLDKNSNHSYPTSPTTNMLMTSSIRTNTSSSSCSTPPVSPHRIPIFRNSMPKTATSRTAAGGRVTGVQQLSTSWEFIRPAIKCENEKNLIGDLATTLNGHNNGDVSDSTIPPRYLNVQRGKISFGPPPLPPQRIPTSDKDEKDVDKAASQARRIVELEDALVRLQERVNQSQHGSSTLEKELKQQIDDMSKAIKTKDKRTTQVCHEHKSLQDKFEKQETVLKDLQTENRGLQKRIQQYEKCLDDVTKKVIDAIINEDRLRVEVGFLKERVLDLEAQTVLPPPPPPPLSGGSPAKHRGDEGYCTMPPMNSTLENLPEEEPEQYLIATCSAFNCCSSDGIAEPCTAEMEDWSLSQEDVGGSITLDEDWIWKEATSINAPPPIDADHANLLDNPIVYSDDDEELVCKEFTSDYYRLVNLKSESNKSLVLENDNNEFNPVSSDGDHCNDEDSDDDDEDVDVLPSPTASEKGRQLVFSCSSSSESSHELLNSSGSSSAATTTTSTTATLAEQRTSISLPNTPVRRILSSSSNSSGLSRLPPAPPVRRCNLPVSRSSNLNPKGNGSKSFISTTPLWRPSTGWRRISPQTSELITQANSLKSGSAAELSDTKTQIVRPKTNGSLLSSNTNNYSKVNGNGGGGSSSSSVSKLKPVCNLKTFKS